MPSDYYRPGDPFRLDVRICCADDTEPVSLPLFVVLNVYGEYFFAPSYTRDIGFFNVDVRPGMQLVVIIQEFPWPENAGEGVGITWFAAMTNPPMTDLFGEMDMATFGWGAR